jgi:hypothetical protein
VAASFLLIATALKRLVKEFSKKFSPVRKPTNYQSSLILSLAQLESLSSASTLAPFIEEIQSLDSLELKYVVPFPQKILTQNLSLNLPKKIIAQRTAHRRHRRPLLLFLAH